MAMMALARFLKQKVEGIDMHREDSRRPRRGEGIPISREGSDKAAIDLMTLTDPTALGKEIEASSCASRRSTGTSATGELRSASGPSAMLSEVRNLGIGKPCTEIAGEDLDGKSFKLSDYRGKVVVIDFWGDW